MKPKSFDDLSTYYLEPYEYKSIGNWARQLVHHIPSINKIPTLKPVRSLKRSYLESGTKYIDWLKQNFYNSEIDLLLMSESLNFSPLYTMFREYFRALPSIMFVHCTELDFDKPLRSQSSLWGELATMSLVDRVHFFSDSSKRDTLRQMREFLSSKLVDDIEAKSVMIPLPIELRSLGVETFRPLNRPPTILFNHRLDPDKGYLQFFQAIDELHDQGAAFNVIICGQPSTPSREQVVRKHLTKWGSRVLHYGLVLDREKYAELLHKSDIVVNACCEVVGISAIEAVYCGCWPIVYDEGALLDIFGNACDKYHTVDELVSRLSFRLKTELRRFEARSRVESLDWNNLRDKYKDEWFQVYEKKTVKGNLTGALRKVVDALKESPKTKEQVLQQILGWGSFDYWPTYRSRLLQNGVSYEKGTNKYYLDEVESLNESATV